MPLFAGLLTAPDGAKLVGILAAHFGSLSEGEAAVKPLKAFGPPVMDAWGRCRIARSTGCSTRHSPGEGAELLESPVHPI